MANEPFGLYSKLSIVRTITEESQTGFGSQYLLHLCHFEGRLGDSLVYLTLSGSVEEVLVRVAVDHLRAKVLVGDAKGLKENGSVGSHPPEGLLFLVV